MTTNQVLCPFCSTSYSYDPTLNGQRVACSTCGNSFVMFVSGRKLSRNANRTSQAHRNTILVTLVLTLLALFGGIAVVHQADTKQARKSVTTGRRPPTSDKSSVRNRPLVMPTPNRFITRPPLQPAKHDHLDQVTDTADQTPDTSKIVEDRSPAPVADEATNVPFAVALPDLKMPAADPNVQNSRLIAEFKGVGNDEHINTPLFNIQDDWGFDWEVRGGMFNIVLEDPAGAPRQGAFGFMESIRRSDKNHESPKNTVREIWWIDPHHGGGPQHGHINYHRGGKYYLSVWATGPWRVRIYQYPNRL